MVEKFCVVVNWLLYNTVIKTENMNSVDDLFQ